MKPIYVTKSSMPPYEDFIERIKPLWETHHLTNMGTYHKELEEKLARFLDVPEMSLMSSGHMSLELTLQAFDFPEGSEIITTPFTFISTTHAIIRNRLIPIFCDVKDTDGTMDETKIEQLITPKTVAILPVHVYGNICNVEKIAEIAARHDLRVIYDAAHAFGEETEIGNAATFGDASVFSFHATKVFHTIEGGAVVCKTHELYDKLYNLKNFGIRGEETVVSVGANAKMNELSAIMGLCNLERFSETIEKRRKVRDTYDAYLLNRKSIHVLRGSNITQQNYGYYPVILENQSQRDAVYAAMRKNDIYVRKYFYPLTSDEICFRGKYKNADIPVARSLSERVLTLPIYEEMTEDELSRVISVLKDCRLL